MNLIKPLAIVFVTAAVHTGFAMLPVGPAYALEQSSDFVDGPGCTTDSECAEMIEDLDGGPINEAEFDYELGALSEQLQ